MTPTITDKSEQPDKSEQLSIRPYARLLTMLGEQLIKNDSVALVELLKNSYDADATLAKVVFSDFNTKLAPRTTSTIVVVDNGDGMSEDVVRDHWLNPATPVKAEQKAKSPKTRKRRSIQGEKGIGRFAMFKLGSRATIVTRGIGDDTEYVIDYDLSFLDNDLPHQDQLHPKFLDELRVSLQARNPEVFDGTNPDGNESEHGTRIAIGQLRSTWGEALARRAFEQVARLQPLIPARDFSTPGPGDEFTVQFWDDDVELPFRIAFEDRLRDLFENRAVLRVNGLFDERGELILEVDDELIVMDLDSPALAGLHVYKSYFGKERESVESRPLSCGSFSFSFFVFDFSSSSPTRYRLDTRDKSLVREHRIYLYRDGIRVLPYGDRQDDWLQLDVTRGTQGASRTLGNDQTVGFVHISHADNPELRDKTNREGLLDGGDAYSDFVTVLRIIAAYIRTKPYARYLDQKRRRQETRLRRQAELASELQDLENHPELPDELKVVVKKVRRSYVAEHDYMRMRAERTEDLAGVGLSVESASHDILAAGGRALQAARSIAKYIESRMPLNKYLKSQVRTLLELVSFVTARLNDIQGLFVSTRQRRKNLDVGEFANRVGRMFRYALEESEIEFTITQPDGVLTVKSTEAALLQALMNLVDNAIYWVVLGKADRRIMIQVEASEHRVIVADTGPGVDADDEPFIFEPFYSGKGIEGKGLGLYIAKQVGIRNAFDVTLSDRPLILPGANFIVAFDEETK